MWETFEEEEKRQPISTSVFSAIQLKFREIPTYVDDETSDEKAERFAWIKDDRRSVKGSSLRFDAIDSYCAVAFRSSREFLRRRENILIYRSLIKW